MQLWSWHRVTSTIRMIPGKSPNLRPSDNLFSLLHFLSAAGFSTRWLILGYSKWTSECSWANCMSISSLRSFRCCAPSKVRCCTSSVTLSGPTLPISVSNSLQQAWKSSSNLIILQGTSDTNQHFHYLNLNFQFKLFVYKASHFIPFRVSDSCGLPVSTSCEDDKDQDIILAAIWTDGQCQHGLSILIFTNLPWHIDFFFIHLTNTRWDLFGSPRNASLGIGEYRRRRKKPTVVECNLVQLNEGVGRWVGRW